MDIDTSATDLAELLVSGGDARLTLDRHSGLNKYLCPPWPAPELACFASCTATPIAPEGLAAAQAALGRVACGSVAQEAERIAASLGGLLGLAGLAEAFLAPSGTDATLRALGLLVAEQPGRAITSIMVAGEETGAGVPLAAAGRQFSGAAAGSAVAGFPEGMTTVTVAVRDADGTARAAEAVSADFARAVAAARGRPVVHLIDCSKTGIVAPDTVPEGVEVIVDACQARLPPERIREYLRRGWPVLITGSKFYGGPPFSGAVLYPLARRAVAAEAVNLGTVLRWAAALDEMTRFAAWSAAEVRARMHAMAEQIRARIAAVPGLVPVALPAVAAEAWPPSILTFAIRGPAGLLTLAEVQARHRALAAAGVLVGQAVALGADHGALRIAIGARTLREAGMEGKLDRLYHALGQITRGRA